jgi:hypothetical protein
MIGFDGEMLGALRWRRDQFEVIVNIGCGDGETTQPRPAFRSGSDRQLRLTAP